MMSDEATQMLAAMTTLLATRQFEDRRQLLEDLRDDLARTGHVAPRVRTLVTYLTQCLHAH